MLYFLKILSDFWWQLSPWETWLWVSRRWNSWQEKSPSPTWKNLSQKPTKTNAWKMKSVTQNFEAEDTVAESPSGAGSHTPRRCVCYQYWTVTALAREGSEIKGFFKVSLLLNYLHFRLFSVFSHSICLWIRIFAEDLILSSKPEYCILTDMHRFAVQE